MIVASSEQLGFTFAFAPAGSVRVFSGHYWSLARLYSSPGGRAPTRLAPGNFINIVETGHESAAFRLYTSKAAFQTNPGAPALEMSMLLRAGVLAGCTKTEDVGFRLYNGWDQFNRERLVIQEYDAASGLENGNGEEGSHGGGTTDPGGGGVPK